MPSPQRIVRPRSALLGAMAAAAALLAACASGPAFDGRHYRAGRVAFELANVPPSYRPIAVEGAALAFREDGASIVISGRCDLRRDDTPLEALTNHLLIGTTERQVASEAVVPFDGREARTTQLTAKLDGVVRSYTIYVLKKDGCVYDFVRVAMPKEDDATGIETFRNFVRGFRTLPPREAP